MKKQIHSEMYKGYEILINAKFESKNYDWRQNKETDSVTFYYHVFDGDGQSIYIEYSQIETVYKEQPSRFLFWTFNPKHSFKEKTEKELEYLITYIKNVIDRKIYDREMTEGLLDSLN